MLLITSLYQDYLVSSWGPFSATIWDWLLFAGMIGLFLTPFLLFVRFLPIVSSAEIKESMYEAQGPTACVNPSRNDTDLFGILAEFDRPDRLIESVRLHPCPRLSPPGRLLAVSDRRGRPRNWTFADNRVAWLTFGGGVLGAAAGYGIQLYTNWSYPHRCRRPRELRLAGLLDDHTDAGHAVRRGLFAVYGMLLLNHLPRLNHPLFGVDGFQLASADRFFLVVFSTDPKFHETRTRTFLEGLDPLRIETVAHSEQPE